MMSLRFPIGGALIGGALVVGLLLAACGSGGEDQQQAASSAPAAPEAQQSQDQTQQQVPAEAAEADEPAARQSAQQDDAQADQPQTAAEQSGDATVSTVNALQPVPVDELSPRLALLTDGGYPVFISPDGFSVALGTPDLGLGQNRVSVVVESDDGLVEFPALALSYWPVSTGPESASDALAAYTLFPDGIRGFHVAQLTFGQAGDWVINIRTPSLDGFIDIPIAITVRENTLAPAVGEQPPASINRTLRDVVGAEELSTAAEPDAMLYEVTIAEALENGEPFVVVFASPGFCTNAFCGPQVEVLSELRLLYPAGVRYIHVDLYENPLNVRRGEPPQRTPLLEEWGLHTDEWTFIVDGDGQVVARFEAFAPIEEIEAALVAALERS